MKRKRSLGKLTTSELRAAGHVDLAEHCIAIREISFKGRVPFQFRKEMPRGKKFQKTPETKP